MKEPYAFMLDLVSEGMTIGTKEAPIKFDDTIAYFSERHWWVKETAPTHPYNEQWVEAPTQLHNELEVRLRKGMFQ